MLKPFTTLLRTPGALGFSAAGFVGRLPISMTGLSLVLLVAGRTGDYRTAGAVSAVSALATALCGPRLARLVDRHGQARVALPATALTAVAAGLLVADAALRAPVWTLYVGAAVMGAAYPSVGSLVRARWSALLGHSSQLSTAFSLESTLDEVVFIVGPTLATFVATAATPYAALLLIAALALGGTTALCAQRGTEPPPAPTTAGRGGVARYRGVPVVALACVCYGGVFGCTEVVTVAFAAHRHHPGAAGLLLACMALGSCLAAIAVGSAGPARLPLRRFLAGSLGVAVVTLPLPLIGSLPELAVALFVAGFTVSPTLIICVALVEELVPSTRLTEGFTLLSAGLGLGVTIGSSVGGWAVDEVGTPGAYVVATVSGVAAALVALVGAGPVRRGTASAPTTFSGADVVAGEAAGGAADAADPSLGSEGVATVGHRPDDVRSGAESRRERRMRTIRNVSTNRRHDTPTRFLRHTTARV